MIRTQLLLDFFKNLQIFSQFHAFLHSVESECIQECSAQMHQARLMGCILKRAFIFQPFLRQVAVGHIDFRFKTVQLLANFFAAVSVKMLAEDVLAFVNGATLASP